MEITRDESTELETTLDALVDEAEETKEFKWLTDKTKTMMAESINKAARGIAIEQHNNYIMKVAAILKKQDIDISGLFVPRKTKKYEKFYGYSTDLYNEVMNRTDSELPSL